MIRHVLSLLALVAHLAGGAIAGGIPWQPTLESALADAKARKVPVFLAVNMDGERANDEMVNVHYLDPRIVELASGCAALFVSVDDHSGTKPCKRCGGPITCADHRALEKAVRGKYTVAAADGGFIAPQHVLLDPEGKVLLSVAYRISVPELEWCLATARSTVDPAFEWKLSENAKPPRRLVRGTIGSAGSEASQKAPTKKEVDEILAELTKSKKFFDKIDLMYRLVRSNDKRALEFFATLLESKFMNRDEGLLELLRAIGRSSPPEYAPLVHPFLDDERPAVRSQAIVTLELLANPKSLPPLSKCFKKKDVEPRFAKDLVRAIAACGPADPTVAKLVLSTIDGAADPIVRANAMLAAEHLENRKVVLEAVDRGLAQPENSGLRFAAGHVIAALLDTTRQQALDAATTAESDPRAKSALAACGLVLAGTQPLTSLDPYLRDLCQSELPRDRQ